MRGGVPGPHFPGSGFTFWVGELSEQINGSVSRFRPFGMASVSCVLCGVHVWFTTAGVRQLRLLVFFALTFSRNSDSVCGTILTDVIWSVLVAELAFLQILPTPTLVIPLSEGLLTRPFAIRVSTLVLAFRLGFVIKPACDCIVVCLSFLRLDSHDAVTIYVEAACSAATCRRTTGSLDRRKRGRLF